MPSYTSTDTLAANWTSTLTSNNGNTVINTPKTTGAFRFSMDAITTKEDTDEHFRGELRMVFYRRGPTGGSGYKSDNFRTDVSFINVQDLMAKFFLNAWSKVRRVDNWRHYCIGVSSARNCYHEHLPMLDYDGKGIRAVREDVKNLQKNFKLGPATLFATKRGFHVYFGSNLVKWSDFEAILTAAKCDPKFKTLSKANLAAVLRVSAKYTKFDIEFREVIQNPNHRGPVRPSLQFQVISALIRMGTECETHIASLYPELAKYKEDPAEWKPRRKASATQETGLGTIHYMGPGGGGLNHGADQTLKVWFQSLNGGLETNTYLVRKDLPLPSTDNLPWKNLSMLLSYQTWLCGEVGYPAPGNVNFALLRDLFEPYWQVQKNKLLKPAQPVPENVPAVPAVEAMVSAESGIEGGLFLSANYSDGSFIKVDVKLGYGNQAAEFLKEYHSITQIPVLPYWMKVVDVGPGGYKPKNQSIQTVMATMDHGVAPAPKAVAKTLENSQWEAKVFDYSTHVSDPAPPIEVEPKSTTLTAADFLKHTKAYDEEIIKKWSKSKKMDTYKSYYGHDTYVKVKKSPTGE